MIKNMESVSMSEAVQLVKSSETENPDFVGFVGKFKRLSPEKSKELRAKLSGLGLIKVKPEHVTSIADVLPDNSVDLNKIFSDVSLDEDETKKILDVVKEYK